MAIPIRRLWIVACLLFPVFLAGQDLPDKPEILMVSVDTSFHGPSFRVIIKWLPSESEDVAYYRIYKDNNEGAGLLIDSVDFNVTSYMHSLPILENLKYSVTAYDSSGNESLRTPGEHRAVLVDVDFDTCYNRNKLSWNPYEGWGENLSHYEIEISGDCGNDTTIIIGPNARTFFHEDIQLNSCYTYLIKSIESKKSLNSFSNIVYIQTNLPDPPQYLQIESVNVIDKSTVELTVNSDVSSSIRDFQLLRSTEPEDGYHLASYGQIDHETIRIRDEVNTTLHRYFYRVESVYRPQGCPVPKVLASSNPGSTILLNGSEENRSIYLSWTPYFEFPVGVNRYFITRFIGDEPYDVGYVTAGTNTFEYVIPPSGPLNGQELSQTGELKFMIRAISNLNQQGDSFESQSNILAIPLSTTLQMPNAFTPNDDLLNDRFGPVIDYTPEYFLMIIYDRAGRKIFETNDPHEGWDGTFRGGEKVMEGVYVYFLQYTEYTGIKESLTGNVTVIYP